MLSAVARNRKDLDSVMASNSTLVKELREKTGAGILDCQKALTETGNETIEHLVTSDFIKGATKILTKSKDQPKYERR